MKSAVTIALVPGIQSGPWVYWHQLEAGMEKAAALGFDAVELFTADAASVDIDKIKGISNRLGIKIAALGTGAGKVLHGLTLTDNNPVVRQKAVNFITEMIVAGAALGAPAIIGSMQGNAGDNRISSLHWLSEALEILGAVAEKNGVPLIYEPLNRYETNLFNRLGDAAAFLKANQLDNVKLLADLFHMNIEEASIGETIRNHAALIGHVHFADSNRQAIGFGHTDMRDIATALKDTNYAGYISAEIFPLPDSDTAAKQTIVSFNQWFT